MNTPQILRVSARSSALSFVTRCLAIGVAAVALASCNDSSGSAPSSDDKTKNHSKDHDGEKKGAPKKSDEKATTSGGATTAAPASNPDPNAIAFYLSMHGASGSDTIVGVTDDGKLLGSVVRNIPADNQLHLLRGLCLLPDRSVLVSNAFRTDTKVLRFGPIAADRTASFASVFVQGGDANPALTHTYAVAVAPDGSVYCSNQDTDTVTRYAGVNAATPGAPLPSPPSLAKVNGLAPAVFIPSRKDHHDGLIDVRGLAFGPDGLLYVADKGRHQVASYDLTSGERRAIVADDKRGLKDPIQVAFTPDGASMFISDNGTNSVWRVDRKSGAVSEFVPPGAGGLNAPSALVVDGDRLLVGNRMGKAVIAVRISDGQVAAKPFLANLPDDPEFLLRVK